MEDTLELAQKMILPQTQSLLYVFDGIEEQSMGRVMFPVRADPYNIVTEFCVIDVESSYNAILGRPWIQMMKVVLSTRHQLLKYLTTIEMTDIRGDQVSSCSSLEEVWLDDKDLLSTL